MKSKFSTAVAAIVAASAVGAGLPAMAAAPVPPVAANHHFPTSGSTALNNAINEYFLLNDGKGPCQGNELGTGSDLISVYTDASATYGGTGQFSGFHQITVVCKSAAALGTTVSVGDVIAISKESNGGSLEGTINVARGTPLAFLDPVTGAIPGCTYVGPKNVGGATNANQYSFEFYNGCTPGVANYAPVIGWADEIPQTWELVGNRLVTQGDVGKLNTNPLVQNVFGIGVSLNLYRSLQAMQGLTVGDDTLANMPSLSQTVIAGLYTGNIASWAGLINAAGQSVTNAAFNSGHAVNGNQLWLCRRGDSSGTNAWVDLTFTGNRCNANGQAQLPASTANSASVCKGLPAGGISEDYGCGWVTANNKNDVVFAGAGGGDVASCLDYHDLNNDFAIGNLTTNQAFGGANETGTSTGRAGPPADTGTNTHFRFVAIDGHKPNLLSIANGQYPFVEDDVINTLNTAGAAVVALGTNIANSFDDTNVILDFDNASTQTQALSSASGHAADKDWTAGLLYDPLSTSVTVTPNAIPTTTAALIGAGGNPTSPYTQQSPSLNNCAPPLNTVGAVNP